MSKAWVLKAPFLSLLFWYLHATAEIPKEILVQEVASCAVRRGDGVSENDPRPYQPCESPPVNTLLVREFADGTFGFYADYSHFATTQSSCNIRGIGTLSARSIVGSVLQFEQQGIRETCKISLKWTEKRSGGFSGFEFQELSPCSGVCGTNNNVGSIAFSGNSIDAFSPAFDCSKARLPAEKTVCLDWDLAKLDFQLTELWRKVQDGDNQKQSQLSWLKGRDSCGFNSSCLRSSYLSRIKSLCLASGGKIDARNDCQ